MDRRLPRSPALKSPMLSPKSPAIYEKYKSGCAWGLIHFFDFRQAHFHGKLISDKKRTNRQAKGDGYKRNKPTLHSNREKAQYADDAVDNKNVAAKSRKRDVKNIIKEEMPVKHQTENEKANVELQNQPVNPKLVSHSKENRKASKSSKKSCRFPVLGCDAATEVCRQPSDKKMVEESSKNNLAPVTEASYSDANTTNGGNCCKNVGGRKHCHQMEINVQVKMNEAVEAFVDQKLTDGESLCRNEVANCSNEFIDALEVLNSNKELFMKLLQDPNSLLVKHIQDLRDSQVKKQQPRSSSKAKTSQCQPKGAEECEGSADAQMFLSKGSDMPQLSNTTAVSKSQNFPDKINNWPSPQSSHSSREKERSVRPTFLSFEHMKRKLRHAMRVNKKEDHQMFLDDICRSLRDFEQFEDGDKEKGRQEIEKISASNVEKMSESFHEANRRDEINQAYNTISGIGSEATSSTESCHRTSNLLTVRHLNENFHPNKHSSDMSNRGNEDFSRKQTRRTLDRLKSFPEYDLLCRLTPQRDKGREFASPQMRFSPYSNYSTVNVYKWRVQKEKNICLSSPINTSGVQPVSDDKRAENQSEDAKKSTSVDLSPLTKVRKTVHSLADDFSHKGNQTSVCPGKVVEGNHAVRCDKCESNALDVTLEPNGVQNTSMTQGTEAINLFRENEYFECSKLNSPSRDQTSFSSTDVYSSSPPFIQRAKISDSMSDREGQPSPISVLEQVFVEENTSSPSTVPLAVESSCLDIEEDYATSLLECQLDPKNNAGTSEDKQGSLSECIRELLQLSGLNWDELSKRWHLSDQMLDTSLFDNVEVWPKKSRTDQRLLFGYISEVLLEIYQCYFRCSPWISLVNLQPKRAMLSKNMVHEVLRHVDWLLLSNLPQQTLQQLVEKDLRKSGTWIDIQLGTEEAVTELVDSILEDLVADAAI
ncbi:uncharacterized protein LOC120155306 [Hibiscus syriacus]|uniref:uncharacterized protein LOC120155306 n=1 Tax=Hibiscus syriacus TaxID=106335 RepID=UPI0019208601|nr:uncharacterized protein LOC120155306 [Hibiscus syriacus]